MIARFHLHVHNGLGITRDAEGAEFTGRTDAEHRVIEGVRSFLSEEVRGGSIDLRGRGDIAPPDGKVLRTVRFGERVHIDGDPEAA